MRSLGQMRTMLAPFLPASAHGPSTKVGRVRRELATAGRGASELLGAASSISLDRSEEHTSELQSLMRISYAVFCLKKTQSSTLRFVDSQHTTSDSHETYRTKGHANFHLQTIGHSTLIH